MQTVNDKLKPILKERGIRLEDFAKQIGISRNQLYLLGGKSIVDGSFLNRVADELQIDHKYFDEFRHPSVHQANNQHAIGNEGTVSQNIGGSANQDMKTMYEKIIQEKNDEIIFLRNLLNTMQKK